ncbi:glyoxalase superfamily protein [Sulfitobacter sp. SK011]|uniref:glyoxalase superfamily protein n=1 Tax=Sulfitobacter sp. SK011 TaxID=1389004 RepID=UPI000E0A46AC|nr:glyoxalase superfamily protein [Sulfitobacter sp. SK011]AXI42990.1 glyoxalase/bleomycin resistance/extradiol dioxygenase family protein [Sulfitobacter sp. SK011]
MKPPVPILRSFDETATRAFYLDFLGFELVFEHRFEPDTPLYMGVKKGDCALHLSEHFGDATPGTTLRIEVADVHGFAKDLNAKNYRNARPGVQRQPWGWDDMSINDPSGNKLIFCTPNDL